MWTTSRNLFRYSTGCCATAADCCTCTAARRSDAGCACTQSAGSHTLSFPTAQVCPCGCSQCLQLHALDMRISMQDDQASRQQRGLHVGTFTQGACNTPLTAGPAGRRLAGRIPDHSRLCRTFATGAVSLPID